MEDWKIILNLHEFGSTYTVYSDVRQYTVVYIGVLWCTVAYFVLSKFKDVEIFLFFTNLAELWPHFAILGKISQFENISDLKALFQSFYNTQFNLKIHILGYTNQA